MANFTNIDDIIDTALWRAGEPQDSTSDYWSRVVEYINKVQQTLLLGGGVAVGRDLATSAGIYNLTVTIPLTDWWWSRKRGVLTVAQGLDSEDSPGSGTARTVTATKDSTTLTFSGNITPSLAGYRIVINNQETMPIISTHTAGTSTATLDAVWPQATETAVSFQTWPWEVSLASDFLRFAGAPWLHSDYGQIIDMVSKETLVESAVLQAGYEDAPRRFALVRDQVIVFDRYDTDRSHRFEYDYIAQPTDLAAGETPLLPRHHRQVLSTGAAMMILFDKNDARAENAASEYRELVMRMAQEHRKMLGSGSSVMGQFLVRNPGFRGGGYRRGRQPMGEWFLT